MGLRSSYIKQLLEKNLPEDAFFRFSKQPTSHPFHVCTVANRFRHHIDKLYLSCKQYGVDLKMIGLGEAYKGHYLKLQWMLDYVRTLQDDEIVLFVDGFDVLVLADSETLLRTFKQMNAPIVIAAERECYPYADLKNAYPSSPTSFRYINSGTYMGYASALREWLEDLNINQTECDQGQVTKHFLANREKNFLKLDYHCELFLPLYMVKREELVIEKETNRLYFPTTQTRPCVLHANSGTKEVLGIWKEIYCEMIERNFLQKLLMK